MGACRFLHWSPPDDVIKICVPESIVLQKKALVPSIPTSFSHAFTSTSKTTPVQVSQPEDMKHSLHRYESNCGLRKQFYATKLMIYTAKATKNWINTVRPDLTAAGMCWEEVQRRLVSMCMAQSVFDMGWTIDVTTRPTTLWKQCVPFERWAIIGKRNNTYVTMSITKDSTFATMAGEKYKVAFRCVQWAFNIDQCISSLFFLSLYFDYYNK